MVIYKQHLHGWKKMLDLSTAVSSIHVLLVQISQYNWYISNNGLLPNDIYWVANTFFVSQKHVWRHFMVDKKSENKIYIYLCQWAIIFIFSASLRYQWSREKEIRAVATAFISMMTDKVYLLWNHIFSNASWPKAIGRFITSNIWCIDVNCDPCLSHWDYNYAN